MKLRSTLGECWLLTCEMVDSVSENTSSATVSMEPATAVSMLR